VITKKGAFLVVLVSLGIILISLNSSFGQEQEKETIQGPPMQEISTEPEMQWLWGEVVSVDPANSQVTVKYLDYDNDTEKEMVVNVDEKTGYENSKSIGDIKSGDTVSIDYVVSPEGKSVAKNISVEKPENTQNLQEGAMPEDLKMPPPAGEKGQAGSEEPQAAPAATDKGAKETPAY